MTPDYNTSDSLRWNNVVKSIVMGTLRAASLSLLKEMQAAGILKEMQAAGILKEIQAADVPMPLSK